MKILGKTIILFSVSLVLASCGSSRNLSTSSVVNTGYICTGMTGNGDLIVKATAFGNGRDSSLDNAIRGAVDALLFSGIEGDTQNRVRFQSPIVNDRAAIDSNRQYFDQFFSQGQYRKFASVMPSVAPIFVNSGSGYKAVIYLIIQKNTLRKELENHRVIKSLQNVF